MEGLRLKMKGFNNKAKGDKEFYSRSKGIKY
jgi:hypothetical protein